MDVKVQKLPGYNIAYVRSIGPYGPAGGVQEAWNRLVRWATARDLWNSDRVCLGISHDDPRVTEPARCRLFGGWLPQSGYQPDNRLIFELYRGNFGDEATGIMTCELCVPVRSL